MDGSGNGQAVSFELKVLESRTVEEMVGKIRPLPFIRSGRRRCPWREAHGDELWRHRGHDHVVVVTSPDVSCMTRPMECSPPHERFPDGREVVYTDAAHADAAYEPD